MSNNSPSLPDSEQTDTSPSVRIDGRLSVGIRDVLRDLWRGRSLWSELGPPVLSLGRGHRSEVATFDVFDTLITRVSLDPEAVWVRMADLLHEENRIAVPRERIVEARREAQHRVSGEEFPVLERIHQELARLLEWDEDRAARSAAAEIRAEQEMSRPIPAGIKLLRMIREHTPRVVYASDMHLPSTVIRDLLLRHGCWVEGDTLWVSAAAGASKRTGQMFKSIAQAERTSPRRILHVGDQPFADSAAPRWLGVQVAPFQPAAPTRYEHALARRNESIGVRLAEAGRMARLSHHEVDRGIADVTTGVIGPFLVGYALWLLREAKHRGLGRLYFLSRDGEILLTATTAVARAIGETPELRYLYGGRMAWMLPATDVASDYEWSRLLDYLIMRHTKVTPAGLSLRLGLDDSQLEGLTGFDSTRPLEPDQRGRLRSLLADGPLRQQVMIHAERERGLAIRYLKQEGFADGVPSAVIDVGWEGGTMQALASLLAGWADPPLSLFVGYSGPPQGLPGGHAAYLWDGPDSDAGGAITGFTSLIEMFCAGSHGGVAGYEATGGTLRPRLLAPRSIAAEVWPLAEMHAVVSTLLDESTPSLQTDDLESRTGALVGDVLRLLRTTPTREEASVWGGFPREEDPQGDSVFPMARPYVTTDLAQLFRPGPFAGRNLTWPEAALTLTPMPTRLAVATTLRMVSLGRRITELLKVRGVVC